MRISVYIPSWQIDDGDLPVPALGRSLEHVLIFHAADDGDAGEDYGCFGQETTLRGTAIPLPSGDRADPETFPTELRCGDVSFYWRPAQAVSGQVTVTGIVRSDDYGFAPRGFRPAHGIVTSLVESSLLYVLDSPGSGSWIPAPEHKQQFRPLGSYGERLGPQERHGSPQMLVTGVVVGLETAPSADVAMQGETTGDTEPVVRIHVYPDCAGTVLWFHEPIPTPIPGCLPNSWSK
ncbi:hypothetical protein AL755_14815 [Arthrobacter sp. ERGS1:01]|uniref:hypothetical protein n=1 Tax=Arthrobacter sp. ERGS1:01 TaxID=1704044 RepID=UPI0006B445EE|nr:hypothetical protein [Arthrobacter sp. ERGS1:01]ALE06434.1 hypothetical protein AL755_14815 [Arthrobacter sp. ERGS1:01]